jgi:hypothetical protein
VSLKGESGAGPIGRRRGLTFKLESEVICQVATFMITSQQKQRIGVPNLEGPQIKNALKAEKGKISRLRVTLLFMKPLTSMEK